MDVDDSLIALRHLIVLRNLFNRWTEEHQALLASDPVRARHHADALSDLHRMITRLEADSARGNRATIEEQSKA
jgi:hypothetical protein